MRRSDRSRTKWTCIRSDTPAGLSSGKEKPMKQNLLLAIVLLSLCVSAVAQVNSGSDGSDGAFNPTTNIVINMADHPTGIYQYTSVKWRDGDVHSECE
jgi:hypothetical protein